VSVVSALMALDGITHEGTVFGVRVFWGFTFVCIIFLTQASAIYLDTTGFLPSAVK
jgi:hypothetical protein